MAGPLPDRLQPRALIFGSIATLADTSEIERDCFNRAFEEAGLDWRWDAATYGTLLAQPDDAARITRFAETQDQQVDAQALLAAKGRCLADVLERDGLIPRPGVAELVAAAKGEGMSLALASTVGADALREMLDALRPEVSADDFACLGVQGDAAAPKPAPDIYTSCLRALGLSASDAVAIEDTPDGVAAAVAAGIVAYAYPARAAATRTFPGAMDVLDRPEPTRILAMDPCTGTRPMTEGERVIDS